MFQNTLLVIAYYFPPMGLSGVQRTMKFVKYLPQYGWKVIVLTAQPKSYYAYDESLAFEIDKEGIEVFRASKNNKAPKKKEKEKKFPSYFTQKIGRGILQTIYQPDSKIGWKKSAVKMGEKIMREYPVNAIFSTAPPFTDFLVANELSKKFSKPFIVDYRDTWVDNPFHFYPTPFHKNRSINLETDILTHAEKAIVTTRYSKELLLKRYRFLNHNDVLIIPHGFDPDDFYFSPEIQKSEKFTITHSGVFQDNRTPKYFLKALKNFIEKNPSAGKDINAKFVGLMRSSHTKMVKKMGLESNVDLVGYVPHKEAVGHIINSDVLWMMLNDTIRTPGKLYEYFGARKPLLVSSPPGIMRTIAEESGCAICTDPKDVKAIESAIAKYYNMWKTGNLPEISVDFTSKYDRSLLTGELARELAMVADIG